MNCLQVLVLLFLFIVIVLQSVEYYFIRLFRFIAATMLMNLFHRTLQTRTGLNFPLP